MLGERLPSTGSVQVGVVETGAAVDDNERQATPGAEDLVVNGGAMGFKTGSAFWMLGRSFGHSENGPERDGEDRCLQI
jgi:hypothetical protein